MQSALACVPIALVLALMIGPRCGAQTAGGAGLLSAAGIGALAFGLTPEVFWVSQSKGFLLSAYVLAVMWPALFLFHWLNAIGAIEATARGLESLVSDRGMCALLMAWSLSGVFEGVAGFGLPVAIVSPMLVAIGVQPARAVAAVAVGHAWAVTFGSMGIIFDTLITITGLGTDSIAHWASLLLGIACIGCGLGAAFVLGEQKRWPLVVVIGAWMALVQYGLCAAGLTALGSLGAGAAGLLSYIVLRRVRKPTAPEFQQDVTHPERRARSALACYGALAGAMGLLAFWPDLRLSAESVSWKASYQQVATSAGFITAPAHGPVFRPFTHPGSLITVAAVIAVAVSACQDPQTSKARLVRSLKATAGSGTMATLGILFMVGMSTLMDHCGMTLLLAKTLSNAVGGAYPVISPLIGVLGSFATGSNNNSNIMFATLQKNAALLLQVSPALILASQTAGGSLGSMIAPAKLVIGCSTTGLVRQESLVLRKTLVPMGALLLGLGLIVLLLSKPT